MRTNTKPNLSSWENLRIGITGASGSLGKALTHKLQKKGAFVVGLTHGDISTKNTSESSANELVGWQCGQEDSLEKTLSSLDILILNHGINPHGNQTSKAINQALEVNALSTWRLMEIFENLSGSDVDTKRREIWINTSEAEIQPALSPGYEISKRLIGQLVSIKWNNLNKEKQSFLRIRKLILGPFLSELNPIGIMTPDFVASQIIIQAELKLNLIIVSPNPITYLIMPINEFVRSLYFKLFNDQN